MKKIISISFILFIFLFSTKAGIEDLTFPASSKDAKFMIGLKLGINFTQPLISKRFNVLAPLDNSISQSGIKTYKHLYQNIGYQYAFTGLYIFNKSFDIRFEPTFSTYIYKYQSAYFWENTTNNPERIDMKIKHQQSLKYIEIPLTVRYLFGTGQMRPFFQGGIFYGFLINASKNAEQTESYTNSTGSSTLSTESSTGDGTNLYVKSRYGINTGIGINYNLDAVILTMDINLNFGINKVTNESGRYSNQQFSGGLYDVQDDLRLLIPSINIGILFPLNKPSRSQMKCPN